MTDTSKMRSEFEAAFVEEEVRLHGEGFRSSALYMIEQDTVNVRSAWWAWQASRQAVVVELPGESNFDVLVDAAFVIESCEAAIEAVGLRCEVKP
ncbi:hypothetical protein [Pseudomonas capsici]|uniref:hypothetical protein n=1 Tax=Pseudomonas capsici TaxID=2810614 RepID=UPI0021F1C013|nr:hypothetical protein [Pseudomonas capsici]MCV4343298.1 hypothetical protein [Pseudomonas capsici]